MAAEVVARIGRERLPLFTLASLPPGGLAQTRYLVKRLRASHPDVTILVGRWGAADEEEAQRPGLTAAGAAHVGRTLAQTRDQVLALLSVVGSPARDAEPLAAALQRAGEAA